jgi:hypothetical protein
MAGTRRLVPGSLSRSRYHVIDFIWWPHPLPIRNAQAGPSHLAGWADAVARPVFSTRRKNEAAEHTEFSVLTVLPSNWGSKPLPRSTRASREELRGGSIFLGVEKRGGATGTGRWTRLRYNPERATKRTGHMWHKAAAVRWDLVTGTGAVSSSWPASCRPSRSFLAASETRMAGPRTVMTTYCRRRVSPEVFRGRSTGQPWHEAGHDVGKNRRIRSVDM